MLLLIKISFIEGIICLNIKTKLLIKPREWEIYSNKINKG